MKSFKLLLVFALFGLLYKTIDANQTVEREEKTSFSVEKAWRSQHKKSCPVDKASWVKGVEELYNGCKGAIDKFRGKSKEVADVAIIYLGEYLAKMIYFTDANSTNVKTSSIAILSSLSQCVNLHTDGLTIITGYKKVFPSIINDFIGVAESQSVYIGGDLTRTFTRGVRDLGFVFSKYMNEFEQSCRLVGCRKEIDYECVQKKAQKLMNIVALINETLLNKCPSANQEMHEAVMVLNFLCGYLIIAVHGINGCALDALNAQGIAITQSANSTALSFRYVVTQLIQAICAVTLPLEISIITELLTAVVNINVVLNEALKSIFVLIDNPSIAVGEVATNLLKGVTTSSAITQRGVVPN